MMERFHSLVRSLKTARSYELPDDAKQAYYQLLSYVMQNQHRVFTDMLDSSPTFKINFVCGRSKRTLLHMAANVGSYECLCYLLKKGAQPNVCDRQGITPLQVAARNGFTRCIIKLLEYDADIGIKNTEGMTAIHWLASNGRTEVFTEILNYITNVDVKDDNQQTPLHVACLNGHKTTVLKLLELKADIDMENIWGCTPLYFACRHGHTEVVTALLQRGATLKSNHDGESPIDAALKGGYSHVCYALVEWNVNILQAILQACQKEDVELQKIKSVLSYLMSQEMSYRDYILLVITKIVHNEGIKLLSQSTNCKKATEVFIKNMNILNFLLAFDPRKDLETSLTDISRIRTDNRFSIDIPRVRNDSTRSRTDSTRATNMLKSYENEPENSAEIKTELTTLWNILESWMCILQNELPNYTKVKESEFVKNIKEDTLSLLKIEASSLSRTMSTHSASFIRQSASRNSSNFERLRWSQPAVQFNLMEEAIALGNENIDIDMGYFYDDSPVDEQVINFTNELSSNDTSEHSSNDNTNELTTSNTNEHQRNDNTHELSANDNTNELSADHDTNELSANQDTDEPLANQDTNEHSTNHNTNEQSTSGNDTNENALHVDSYSEQQLNPSAGNEDQTSPSQVAVSSSLVSSHDLNQFPTTSLSINDALTHQEDTLIGEEMMDATGDRLCSLIHGYFLHCQCQSMWNNLKGRMSTFNKFIKKYEDVLLLLVSRKPQLIFEHFSFILENPILLQRFLPAIHSQPLSERQKWFYERLHADKGKDRHDEESVINVTRASLLQSSCYILSDRNETTLKENIAVRFDGEEGVGAGVTREWFDLLVKEILNPDCALFTLSADGSTFQPNCNSAINPDHLNYFQFAGRIMGLALYHRHLITAYFTRSFYKHILGIPVSYTDVDSIDPEYSRNLQWILDNSIDDLGLDITFAVETDVFGKSEEIELKANGKSIPVTDENKFEYVHLAADLRMTKAIKQQMFAFLKGFYNFIPHSLASLFNEYELELMLSGVPDIDLEDWRKYTTYQAGFTEQSPTIQWLWEALSEFTKEEQIQLLQFVTGTSRVPWGGFSNLSGGGSGSLFTICRSDGPPDMLPTASTCFNMLKMPDYTSKEEVIWKLKIAITCGGHGFEFA